MQTPRHCRGVLPIVALALATASCVPSQIRSTLPKLSTRDASYAAQSFPWAPRLYRLFSLLPGAGTISCREAVEPLPSIRRSFHIIDCTPAGSNHLGRMATYLEQGLTFTEEALGVRVSAAEFTLVPPGRKFVEDDWQWLREHSVSIRMAIRFEPDKAAKWEIAAVRNAAHELYHLGLRARGLSPAEGNQDRSEETMASLFENCAEMAVFGGIDSDSLDPLQQSDPEALRQDADALHSSLGALDAVRIIASIAGSDLRLTTPDEVRHLNVLCGELRP